MRQREVWWEEYKTCVSVCVSRDQLLATSFKLRETKIGNGECHSAVEVFTLLRRYVGSLLVTNLHHATS
jgi:hypothetical protein